MLRIDESPRPQRIQKHADPATLIQQAFGKFKAPVRALLLHYKQEDDNKRVPCVVTHQPKRAYSVTASFRCEITPQPYPFCKNSHVRQQMWWIWSHVQNAKWCTLSKQKHWIIASTITTYCIISSKLFTLIISWVWLNANISYLGYDWCWYLGLNIHMRRVLTHVFKHDFFIQNAFQNHIFLD